MDDLNGRTAVITGAASGIGRAMARALGAEGMNVMLADIEAGALDAVRSDLDADGVKAATCLCDVSQADAVGRPYRVISALRSLSFAVPWVPASPKPSSWQATRPSPTPVGKSS